MIDLSAVQAKLKKLQTQNSSSGDSKNDLLWKPEPGTQVIRIVPYKFNKKYPFVELGFYYNFAGKRQILSPASFDEADPILEFAKKLQSTGNKEEWKLGKSLEPKVRIFAPIVVRGKEHEGVKFWSFSKTVYMELLGLISDPDYGDISDINEGRDITVEFRSKEQTGKDFGEVMIRPKPNASKLHTDSDVIEKMIDDQIEIHKTFKAYSYDDLKTLLKDWMANASSANEQVNSGVQNKPAPSAPAPKVEAPAKSVAKSTTKLDSIAQEFDDLFSK